MRVLTTLLAIAAALTMTACASKSSSSTASESNAAATSAATEAGAAASTAPSAAASTEAGAASTQPSAAASMAAGSTAAPGEIPSYPGAVTQASGSGTNMGQSASGTVMTTDDSFDKVYAWYQQHMPAGSEKSHTTAPVQSAVFIIGEPSSGQKSVTITTSAGKTMITLSSVKTP
jgi:hypothetical protein